MSDVFVEESRSFALKARNGNPSPELIPHGLNGLMLQKDFCTTESWGGTGGGFGLTLSIGSTERLLDDDDRSAILKQVEQIESIIRGRIYNAKPETLDCAAKERKDLLACFEEIPIFVEEIPNGYCSDYCHEKFPWFLVTTKRGPFMIGWRKRVIVIDWAGSNIRTDGDILFEHEGVTTGTDMVHAYGYKKAKEYIARLMAS